MAGRLLTAFLLTKRPRTWRTWTNFLQAQKVRHPDGCCGPKSYLLASASSSFSDAAAALFKAGFFPLDARACKEVIVALVTSGWLPFAPAIPISRRDWMA